MLICSVVGARPNFMKIAPVFLELKKREKSQVLVHTGQHYDSAMSDVFFEELNMPEPDVFLGVGSGSHAEQTAGVMIAFERACVDLGPGLVIVGGDVNSTLACALTAAKLGIPVAHIEAGLRSFDRSMPEEINRVLTDHLSELLLTSEPSGNENLLNEGIAAHRIHLVGNCMIDSLQHHLKSALARSPWERFGLSPGHYGVVTLHRPSAVDDPVALEQFRGALQEISEEVPLLFPVHPRTRQRIESSGMKWEPVWLIEPQRYIDFLGLMASARLVLTDSGGIQEETTALGVPCVTMRNNTERPVTVEVGTNRIVGTTRAGIVAAAWEALRDTDRVPRVPALWDGFAAARIADVLEVWLGEHQEASATQSDMEAGRP
jgi:UDP-N-acetylglucosamine 2-epimerase (non-hydrolysing)